MNNDTANNGLTPDQITSTSQACPAIDREALLTTLAASLTEDSKPYFFVAYLDYQVVIGTYQRHDPQLRDPETGTAIQPQYIQRLRVFNDLEELHLWRSGAVFSGRVRKDGVGELTDVIDAEQVLCGTQLQFINTATLLELSEERGSRLVLPFSQAQIGVPPERVFLKTRNYVGDLTETKQATYEDCRFVTFVDQNGNPLQQGGQV